VLMGAWLTGLCLDATFGSVMGQHALALVIVSFIVLRLRQMLVVFPPWQAAGVLVPVWTVYVFLLFWVDGASEHAADPWARWLPVTTTTIVWPVLAQIIDEVRARRAPA
jgi:rod shape-determining protein MreD